MTVEKISDDLIRISYGLDVYESHIFYIPLNKVKFVDIQTVGKVKVVVRFIFESCEEEIDLVCDDVEQAEELCRQLFN